MTKVKLRTGSARDVREIEDRNARAQKWLDENPDKHFSHYYANVLSERLNKGLPHATLGGNLMYGRVHGVHGRGTFNRFLQLGMTPQDTFVDFGCGTLRIGCHFIAFLAPGRYWGLDISRRFLDEGRNLIGEATLRDKRPHLELISETSLVAAAAAKPAFVLSKSVLTHVHPEELDQYFDRLASICHDGTKVVLDSTIASQLVQFEGMSWAYPKSLLQEKCASRGFDLEVIEEEDTVLEGIELVGGRINMLLTAKR